MDIPLRKTASRARPSHGRSATRGRASRVARTLQDPPQATLAASHARTRSCERADATNPFRGEGLRRPLLAVDERHRRGAPRARAAHGTGHRLQRRSAGRGDVLDDQHWLALEALALAEAFDQAAACRAPSPPCARRPRRPAGRRPRSSPPPPRRAAPAHLEAADEVAAERGGLFGDRRPDEPRALGVEHGGLQVEVDRARPPGGELESRPARGTNAAERSSKRASRSPMPSRQAGAPWPETGRQVKPPPTLSPSRRCSPRAAASSTAIRRAASAP